MKLNISKVVRGSEYVTRTIPWYYFFLNGGEYAVNSDGNLFRYAPVHHIADGIAKGLRKEFNTWT